MYSTICTARSRSSMAMTMAAASSMPAAVQQVGSRGVAVEALDADAEHPLDHGRPRGRAPRCDPARHQQPVDDLPEAADAGDDDGALSSISGVGSSPAIGPRSRGAPADRRG
jgi:hypothetical protein